MVDLIAAGLPGDGGGDDGVHRSTASSWVVVAASIGARRGARAMLEGGVCGGASSNCGGLGASGAAWLGETREGRDLGEGLAAACDGVWLTWEQTVLVRGG
jgi:hypothetical protein